MILNQFIIRYLKLLQSKFIFTLLLISILLSCTKNSDEKELLFLITLDTTRADSINYDTNNKETPNLAYLAANGISFKNAYSLIPITLPSHYSMFYSMPPWKARVYNNGDKTSIKYPGLTEILKKKGYFTGAVISLGVLKSDFGLNKGFNSFIENFSPGLWYRNAGEVNADLFNLINKVKRKNAFYWVHYSDPHDPYYQPKYRGEFKLKFNNTEIFRTESTKSITVSARIDLLPGKNELSFATEIPDNFPEEMKGNVSGIGLRGFKVTQPSGKEKYRVEFPEKWVKRNVKDRTDYLTSNLNSKIQIVNHDSKKQMVTVSFVFDMRLADSYKKKAYLEEISYMDKKIGDLIVFLKKKKLFKYSTFIIMGDHGEGFEEYRGNIGHIHYVNKVFMNVPLIISGKNIGQKLTKDPLVSTLNIAPTILDIANIKKPGYMVGDSLLKKNNNNMLFFETYRPQAYYNSFSIIEYPYQLIYFPEKTTADKYEFINLKTDKYGVNNILNKKIALKNRLIKKVRKMAKFCLKNKKDTNKKTKKEEEILRSLGYI